MNKNNNVSKSNRGNFSVQRTVLVVDDEMINVAIMSAILADTFNVLTANDGKEALDILLGGEYKIDLVLLDVFMPVMDGYQVLRKRQKDSKLKRIPFIVMTAEAEIEKECFHLGVNDFIKKPYDNPDIIVARVKRMIELYEDRSIIKEVKRDKLTNLYSLYLFSTSIIRSSPDIKKFLLKKKKLFKKKWVVQGLHP